jgi:hypothetical protein
VGVGEPYSANCLLCEELQYNALQSKSFHVSYNRVAGHCRSNVMFTDVG